MMELPSKNALQLELMFTTPRIALMLKRVPPGSVSIVSGAFTLATGRVFTMHFESGGTVLDFDAGAMRAYFEDEFARAKRTVADLRKRTA